MFYFIFVGVSFFNSPCNVKKEQHYLIFYQNYLKHTPCDSRIFKNNLFIYAQHKVARNQELEPHVERHIHQYGYQSLCQALVQRFLKSNGRCQSVALVKMLLHLNHTNTIRTRYSSMVIQYNSGVLMLIMTRRT